MRPASLPQPRLSLQAAVEVWRPLPHCRPFRRAVGAGCFLAVLAVWIPLPGEGRGYVRDVRGFRRHLHPVGSRCCLCCPLPFSVCPGLPWCFYSEPGRGKRKGSFITKGRGNLPPSSHVCDPALSLSLWLVVERWLLVGCGHRLCQGTARKRDASGACCPCHSSPDPAGMPVSFLRSCQPAEKLLIPLKASWGGRSAALSSP